MEKNKGVWGRKGEWDRLGRQSLLLFYSYNKNIKNEICLSVLDSKKKEMNWGQNGAYKIWQPHIIECDLISMLVIILCTI